jgi:hypothetical protein
MYKGQIMTSSNLFKQSSKLNPVNIAKRVLGISTLASITLFSLHAHAGAWVPEENRGYSKVGVQSYSANNFFGDNPDFIEFNGTNISYYGEQGLGNNLAIYGSVLYSDIEQFTAGSDAISSSGIADVEVGLRYQWIAEPFVLSTSLLVKLPYFYDENDDLPRGNGQEDVEARVLFGKSLYPYGYLGVELGYRARFEAPSDEYRYLIEYGYSFNENAYFRTKLDGIQAVGNADALEPDTDGVVNLLFLPQFDLGTLEVTLGWNFGSDRPREQGRWGVEITYNNNIFGDNIIRGQGVQIGVTRTY